MSSEPLTPGEKAAGRELRGEIRAWLARRNAEDPPGMLVPSVLRHVRHDCPDRGGVSTSFGMREKYVLVPARGGLAAGRLAFIFTEGRCRCGMSGRSGDVRVVDAYDRPPMGRSVLEWQTTVTAAASPESGRTPSR